MHFMLIAPASGQFWESTMTDYGVRTNPQNEGSDHEHILRRLNDLKADGHTYEVLDGDALSGEERGSIYISEACTAVARAGNRYRIRQVFGSRKHIGSDDFGTSVPALIVSKNGEPVDVYPHQVGDDYRTIRGYIDALAV
jgi:hypothetical protein